MAKNDCGQRAYGGKFSTDRFETTMPSEKQDEKCTPARRRTAAASGYTAANSSTPPSKRSRRRRNRIKNARRRSVQQQRTAGTRRQIPLLHRQNNHDSGETTFKMHAGEASNDCDQRVLGDKFLHSTFKTIAPTVKQSKKCTPARRRTAATSGHTATNSSTPPSKLSLRR